MSSGLSSPSVASPFADIIQPCVDRGALAGAVTLVADRDGVLDLAAFGLADLAAGRPMTTDATFWIASQTKPFLGTAFSMLIEEGRVNVDDPVEKYLPEFKGQMVIVEEDETHRLLRLPRHPITVRNALTHTAGLPHFSPVEKPSLDRLPLETAVRSHAMSALQFEPDSRYAYSNAGTNVAGRIIEVVTGQPFEDFLAARLIEPLGLKDTTFWPDAAQVARLAKYYQQTTEDGPLVEKPIAHLSHADLTDRVRRFPFPGGGLFSTAEDCGKFCRMIARDGELDGRRYLSAVSVGTMTTRQAPAPVEEEYGFGWATGKGMYGHAGAYASSMFIDRRTGLSMVIMLQCNGFGDVLGRMFDAFRQAAVERFGAAG